MANKSVDRQTPVHRMLLALQFWNGDKVMAGKLARLIADLEPRHLELADFLFVSRFDCAPDRDVVEYVKRKFNTYTYICRNRGTGHPLGCNTLWFATLGWLLSMREARKVPPYKCMFTIEADGCPMSPTWISEMLQAWDVVQPASVVGCQETIPPHINGNMMVSANLAFLHRIARQVGGVHPRASWDIAMWNEFRKWGTANIRPMIHNTYRVPHADHAFFEARQAEGCVYSHGVMDDSLKQIVRETFLT